MIALIQRVREASVTIDGERQADIDQGLLVLLGVEAHDTQDSAERLLNKVLRYRVFADEAGKMNRSVQDIQGDLLLVPQFTLAANTQSGNRPSFTSAAPPAVGEQWFRYAQSYLGQHYPRAQFGVFGADMQVGLVNDGPVTFWLQM